MSNKKGSESAVVKYQIDGKGKKFNFQFTSLTQPALDTAVVFYKDNYSKGAVKLTVEGKARLGQVLTAITKDAKDSKTKGAIMDSVFPALVNSQRSNYMKLNEQMDKPEFKSWLVKNFPCLNSETHILQNYRKYLEFKETVTNDGFIDWINADDKAGDVPTNKGIDLSDHKDLERLHDLYAIHLADLEMKLQSGDDSDDSDDSAAPSGELNTMKPEEFEERFLNIVNHCITMNNKELFTTDQVAGIVKTIDNLKKQLITKD